MKKYIYITITLIVVGSVCFKLTSSDKPKKEIVVGVIAPLSGPVAAYGESVKKGIQAADGTGIKIVYEDEGCDPKTAITAFKKLIELDHATVIIGPACGSPQKAVAPLVAASHVVAITPSAAPQELYPLSSGMMFDMQYSLEDESNFLAKKMYELGYKNVAIIAYQNEFSAVNQKSFTTNYAGTVVTTLSLDDTSTTIDTDLLRLSKQKFDAMYVTDISFYFAGGMQKLKNNKITVPVFSTYVAELPFARSLVDGVIYAFPKDVIGGDGGTYALSKSSAETIFPVARVCEGDATCIQKKLMASGDFDTYGIKKREIVLKQIVGDRAVLYVK